MTTITWDHDALPLPPALAGLPVLAAPGLAAVDDPAALWDAASRAAARQVAALCPPGGRVALVVPDRTRPLPLPWMLPPLFAALAAEGIAPGRLTLVAASGIHRPMDRAEFTAWIGEAAATSGATLAPHDADAPAVLLGRTACGIDVAAHPAVARAGALLLLGRIVFHYLAGFGGGRKMLVPGCAARRTILAVHRRCLAAEQGAGRHARARTALLDGNPVHEAASAAARLFPPAVAIHIQLAAGGALAAADAGDAFEAHAAAASAYAAAHRVTLDAPLDGIVVSAQGYPADRDLVQAHKALEAVAGVVRDGGTVIFAAACADGVGNRELLDGFALGPPAAIEAALRRDFRVGLHTALAFAEKTRRLRVLALTRLDDAALAAAGMQRVATLDDAARELAGLPRVALAPSGGSLLYTVAAGRG